MIDDLTNWRWSFLSLFLAGPCLPLDAERQLLTLSALWNVQGFSERFQEEGRKSLFFHSQQITNQYYLPLPPLLLLLLHYESTRERSARRLDVVFLLLLLLSFSISHRSSFVPVLLAAVYIHVDCWIHVEKRFIWFFWFPPIVYSRESRWCSPKFFISLLLLLRSTCRPHHFFFDFLLLLLITVARPWFLLLSSVSLNCALVNRSCVIFASSVQQQQKKRN